MCAKLCVTGIAKVVEYVIDALLAAEYLGKSTFLITNNGTTGQVDVHTGAVRPRYIVILVLI